MYTNFKLSLYIFCFLNLFYFNFRAEIQQLDKKRRMGGLGGEEAEKVTAR
jgi:hypothetical protein